jgi:hypothetical protein
MFPGVDAIKEFLGAVWQGSTALNRIALPVDSDEAEPKHSHNNASPYGDSDILCLFIVSPPFTRQDTMEIESGNLAVTGEEMISSDSVGNHATTDGLHASVAGLQTDLVRRVDTNYGRGIQSLFDDQDQDSEHG